jgi:large subunit ribosomal protein L15
MNILSQLEKTVDKRKKRKGRGIGSGSGVKSGRGTTRHQTARTTMPLHFEGGQNRMVKRFPLIRGKAKNKSVKLKPVVITLSKLERFDNNTTVDMKALIEKNLFDGNKDQTVKVVATGTLTKSLTIALPVSESAKKMIEKAGGTVK